MKHPDYSRIDGSALISNTEFNHVLFEPEDPIQGQAPKFRCCGVGQQFSDGTFEFVPSTRPRSQAIRIKKMPHGCISETKDGAYLMVLKVYQKENINIPETMLDEASEGIAALIEYQLKH